MPNKDLLLDVNSFDICAVVVDSDSEFKPASVRSVVPDDVSFNPEVTGFDAYGYLVLSNVDEDDYRSFLRYGDMISFIQLPDGSIHWRECDNLIGLIRIDKSSGDPVDFEYSLYVPTSTDEPVNIISMMHFCTKEDTDTLWNEFIHRNDGAIA